MQFTKPRRVALFLAAAATLGIMLPGQASAGLFDLFKPKPNANSSGKQLVVFAADAIPAPS
jgi:hypothetical protein